MISQNFIQLYADSFSKNWDLPAYSDYNDKEDFTYAQVAEQIARVHLLFEQCKIQKGTKIALIGRNTPRWCITYLASFTYGAVVVPILQDFNPNDVHHIVNHSESSFLFVSDPIWDNLEEEKMPGLKAVFSLSDFNCVFERSGESIRKFQQGWDKHFAKKYPQGYNREDIFYKKVDNSEVIVINYTSGTTGFTKGVMLTANNFAGNVITAFKTELMFRGDKMLAFLPLAHAYGCAFDFLTAAAVGAHVTLLGKIPSPKILLKALAEVKPCLIILVPLILEKIYKNMIQPQLQKKTIKLALTIPMLNQKIYGTIRQKLINAFGGEFTQVIVGGAALNPEVEQFLRKIKFPFTVGYGMTECAPLISYSRFNQFVPLSAGRILDIMQVRVVKKSYEGVGEIEVKGENVMKGYYKNDEATKEAFTKDGWLRTGDLGRVDESGTIFLRGRSKTMILGPSGQNIFPEEIESKLNNMPFVGECLVIEKGGKLVALVYPDFSAMDDCGIEREKLSDLMDENRKQINELVASYERIAAIQIYPTEFEKTPKKSIKRYLYNTIAES